MANFCYFELISNSSKNIRHDAKLKRLLNKKAATLQRLRNSPSDSLQSSLFCKHYKPISR